MTETRHSDEYRILWLIRRFFRAMAHTADGYLQDLGISAADRAVMEFIYPEEKLSVPEIAARYDVSRQHVQVTVNRLLDDGLVATEANPRHKRSSLIVLTRKGKTLFEKLRQQEKAITEALFSGISKDNKRKTLKTLETLYSQLNKE